MTSFKEKEFDDVKFTQLFQAGDDQTEDAKETKVLLKKKKKKEVFTFYREHDKSVLSSGS